MKKLILMAVASLFMATTAMAEEEIGSVETAWNALGSNDRIEITRYDDPKVKGASCYVSRAVKGGLGADIGLGEDRSRFSIACRATGKIEIVGDISKQETVWEQAISTWFKEMRITRMYDAKKNVILYLVWSTKLIDGSPFNSLSAIPVE
jgi:CreA protein